MLTRDWKDPGSLRDLREFERFERFLRFERFEIVMFVTKFMHCKSIKSVLTFCTSINYCSEQPVEVMKCDTEISFTTYSEKVRQGCERSQPYVPWDKTEPGVPTSHFRCQFGF